MPTVLRSLPTESRSLPTAASSTERVIGRVRVPCFKALSRSSAVETRLGSTVRQNCRLPEQPRATLARTYDCPILVQEARHCKPEGAE